MMMDGRPMPYCLGYWHCESKVMEPKELLKPESSHSLGLVGWTVTIHQKARVYSMALVRLDWPIVKKTILDSFHQRRRGKNGQKTLMTFPTALPLVTMFLRGICKPVNSTFLFDRNEFIEDGKRKGVVLNCSNFCYQPRWTLDGKRGIFSMRMECWTVIIHDTSFSTVTMDKSHYVCHRWAPAVSQYHVVASFSLKLSLPKLHFCFQLLGSTELQQRSLLRFSSVGRAAAQREEIKERPGAFPKCPQIPRTNLKFSQIWWS